MINYSAVEYRKSALKYAAVLVSLLTLNCIRTIALCVLLKCHHYGVYCQVTRIEHILSDSLLARLIIFWTWTWHVGTHLYSRLSPRKVQAGLPATTWHFRLFLSFCSITLSMRLLASSFLPHGLKVAAPAPDSSSDPYSKQEEEDKGKEDKVVLHPESKEIFRNSWHISRMTQSNGAWPALATEP